MQKPTTQNGEEGQKMKILALGPNSTKFYTHNMWVTRGPEMKNNWVRGWGFGGGDAGSGCE